ncbi:MAG: hypothetical protein IJ165_10135 [Proteobacteria bacterium]|nr:hypothetical protein [Pseudomonadota bacterium]
MTKHTTRKQTSNAQSPDDALKAFLFRPEIIADMVNAHVYDGLQVVQPEQVKPAVLPKHVSDRHFGVITRRPNLSKHIKCYHDGNGHYILLGVKNQMLVFQVLRDLAEE